MADINDLVDAQRDALKMRDTALLGRISEDYQNVIGRILRDLGTLQAKIDAANASGDEVSPAWLFQERRLKDFLSQASKEFDRFSTKATFDTSKEQFVQVEMAERHFFQQATNSLGNQIFEEGVTFNRLPTRAVEAIVGRSSDGSPLKKLFDQLGPDLGADLRDELIQAVALGQSPARTAARIRELVSGNRARAMTIARTETIQAYREGGHVTSIENNDILNGWIWIATLDGRGCAACIALNGTVHDLAERMAAHPNCRCTKRYETKTFAELGVKGVGETAPEPVEPGHRWFTNASEDVWNSVLGKKGGAAYKAGVVSLRDFIGLRQDAQWGPSYFQRALKDALEGPQPGIVLNYKYAIIPKPPPLPKPAKPIPIPRAKAEELAPIPAPAGSPQTAEAARAELERISRETTTKLVELDGKLAELATERARMMRELPYEQRVISNTYQTLLQVQKDTQASRDLLNDERREAMRAAVRVTDPASFDYTFAKVDVARKQSWHKGLASFRELVSDMPEFDNRSVAFKTNRAQRSNYWGNAVNMSKGAPQHVVVHELGHWLEDISPDIHARVLDFYGNRTAGEVSQWLGQGYARSEKSKFDRFLSKYMGKVYFDSRFGGQYATEIVSMGLEYFDKDPYTLANTDPEFFDFIYNLVRGRETR